MGELLMRWLLMSPAGNYSSAALQLRVHGLNIRKPPRSLTQSRLRLGNRAGGRARRTLRQPVRSVPAGVRHIDGGGGTHPSAAVVRPACVAARGLSAGARRGIRVLTCNRIADGLAGMPTAGFDQAGHSGHQDGGADEDQGEPDGDLRYPEERLAAVDEGELVDVQGVEDQLDADE